MVIYHLKIVSVMEPNDGEVIAEVVELVDTLS